MERKDPKAAAGLCLEDVGKFVCRYEVGSNELRAYEKYCYVGASDGSGDFCLPVSTSCNLPIGPSGQLYASL